MTTLTTGNFLDKGENLKAVRRSNTWIVETIPEICVYMDFGNQNYGFVAGSPNRVERG